MKLTEGRAQWGMKYEMKMFVSILNMTHTDFYFSGNLKNEQYINISQATWLFYLFLADPYVPHLFFLKVQSNIPFNYGVLWIVQASIDGHALVHD